MRIIDVNGVEREALSVKKISQQTPDRVNGGIATTQLYAEVTILGRTGRTWIEYYPWDSFIEANPKAVK